MNLTSFLFLGFVCATLLLYYVIPGKFRYAVLLLASLVFYGSFSIVGIFLLAALSLVAYGSALRIQKIEEQREQWSEEHRGSADKETKKAMNRRFKGMQRRYVVLVVSLCVGSLFLFKYYPPLASELNQLLGTKIWSAENLFMPLGISFYSLQIIGYVIDVSRGITKAEKNPLKVILYASFFLSIMQGPFNRYHDLMPQIEREEKPSMNFYKFKLAVLKITWGYIKKMCIADQMGVITNEVFGNYNNYAGLGILLGAFCFAIQLYADFSGYMDIISGIGDLFGIEMPVNFRQPFFSRNMSEFWQRWHITLGAWLKDYVFYPILKSRALRKFGKWLTKHLGKEAGRRIPTYLGMIVLWTLIGAWHGAGFNYVFGVGLLQFLYIFLGEITEPLTEKIKKKLHIKNENIFWHIFQSLRCTVLMIFAWIFFNSRTFMDALRMLGRIFAEKTLSLAQIKPIFLSETTSVVGLWPNWLLYIFLCTVMLVLADLLHEKGISIRETVERRPYLVRLPFYLALIFTLIIFGAYGSQYDSSNFIYFQF